MRVHHPESAPVRQLLTYGQAAEALGCCERQVYVWAKAGKINATRLGRLVRIHADEIERVSREGIS